MSDCFTSNDLMIWATIGWACGYWVQPRWNRVVDKAFERWWP